MIDEWVLFQSTLPAWGETRPHHSVYAVFLISIHSPRMGRDGWRWDGPTTASGFQSTLPAWGETGTSRRAQEIKSYFNPLSPHGERPRPQPGGPKPGNFNPLSPHGERPYPSLFPQSAEPISIHSPRMGRDRPNDRQREALKEFQSTLPAWGETITAGTGSPTRAHFNPLSPHGERPSLTAADRLAKADFNPLSPHGERQGLSARAPRPGNFNPLSPHGERLPLQSGGLCGDGFQSTLPAWGETFRRYAVRGDLHLFQSTLPAWGETCTGS